MKFRALLSCAAVSLLLADCAGVSPSLPAQPPAPSAPAVAATKHKVNVSIRVVVPKRKHHRMRFVSPSTQGMTIAFSGPTTIVETFGLTPSSPGCSSGGSGTTCTVSVALAACASSANCYSGDVVTYDKITCIGKACFVPPGASALSANQSVAFSVSVGAKNTIPLTLDGIPASVALVPQPSSTLSGDSATGFTISKCVTAPQSVNVVGVDADGNQIVGAGAPTALTLSSNDTTHLAVATPAPSASPSTFTLKPPGSLVSATIPNAGAVAQLTAGVTPLAASGGSAVSRKIDVTFDGTVCGVITEYSLPHPASDPVGIAAGSDGALWFTESNVNTIGRITTGGSITETTIPTSGSIPSGIASGPDGALWFTEGAGNNIGRASGATILETTIPTVGSQSRGITAGPDGALWFAETGGKKIGRITTAGTITETTVPTAGGPFGIAAGPDGALWFTDPSATVNKIGRITTGMSPTITETTIPTGSSSARGITAGPDGALWFTEFCVGKIGRITTGGVITEMTIPTGNSRPFGITAGPDGALWFTECGANKIARITTGGAITTETTIPTGSSAPQGITLGPDGALWFTETCADRIGRDQ